MMAIKKLNKNLFPDRMRYKSVDNNLVYFEKKFNIEIICSRNEEATFNNV